MIEGFITDVPGDCKVRITQTIDFSDSNYFPPVKGAIVTLQDNNNAPVILRQSSSGAYQTSDINGIPGHTYTLLVTIEGKQFSAVSTMPLKVNFDSLYVDDFIGFGTTKKFADVIFNDPPGKGNAYHFVQHKNSLINNSIFVVNDDFSDGRQNNLLLAYFDSDEENDIKMGDTLSVDMQCIDPAIYKYWFSLQNSSTGNSDNASPANPVTNMKGGALGYFSAHTFQTKQIIVP